MEDTREYIAGRKVKTQNGEKTYYFKDLGARVGLGDITSTVTTMREQIVALQSIVGDLSTMAEGYIRVAGSSSPALSYKSYKYTQQGGFAKDSAFTLFYPCLVGTPLTGNDEQIGKILHILKKTGFDDGTGMAVDIYGVHHAIDGSEGDVMICNVEPYHRIMGKYTIDGTEYDVFLVAREAFVFHEIEAEYISKRGVSPDYCVSHTDTDNVVRMHSVYNPDWAGSYAAPSGVVGKFIYDTDPETGDITETYDENATLLGGAGGCHTTNLALYTGEQQAMNMNDDPTKTVPFMNQTAASVEDWFALMLAEGGTFDAHNATLMGSGFSSNDPATTAAQWAEDNAQARNGIHIVDKDGVDRYYALSYNSRANINIGADTYAGSIVNSWRNPFKVMEAHRAVSYAVAHGIGELQWFTFEGNKYKYRSVQGFAGPHDGEMTCVVWKVLSGKLASTAFDPADHSVSLGGNRFDMLVSVAIFHGIATQVSPSWWCSGLVFTEDENGDYECYMQREQEELVITPNGEIDVDQQFNFEESYNHVGKTITKKSAYAKNYDNDALMVPDTNANSTGGGLHIYVGKYNYFNGSNASAGRKSVRGFRRGGYAIYAGLSLLYMNAGDAPSNANTLMGFGTCCRIRD